MASIYSVVPLAQAGFSASRIAPPMIPREILKKIRQIEIRTNRVVTETLAER
jgi:hypothetical protein